MRSTLYTILFVVSSVVPGSALAQDVTLPVDGEPRAIAHIPEGTACSDSGPTTGRYGPNLLELGAVTLAIDGSWSVHAWTRDAERDCWIRVRVGEVTPDTWETVFERDEEVDEDVSKEELNAITLRHELGPVRFELDPYRVRLVDAKSGAVRYESEPLPPLTKGFYEYSNSFNVHLETTGALVRLSRGSSGSGGDSTSESYSEGWIWRVGSERVELLSHTHSEADESGEPGSWDTDDADTQTLLTPSGHLTVTRKASTSSMSDYDSDIEIGKASCSLEEEWSYNSLHHVITLDGTLVHESRVRHRNMRDGMDCGSKGHPALTTLHGDLRLAFPKEGRWIYAVERVSAPDEPGDAAAEFYVVRTITSHKRKGDTLHLELEERGGPYDDKARTVYLQVDSRCVRETDRRGNVLQENCAYALESDEWPREETLELDAKRIPLVSLEGPSTMALGVDGASLARFKGSDGRGRDMLYMLKGYAAQSKTVGEHAIEPVVCDWNDSIKPKDGKVELALSTANAGTLTVEATDGVVRATTTQQSDPIFESPGKLIRVKRWVDPKSATESVLVHIETRKDGLTAMIIPIASTGPLSATPLQFDKPPARGAFSTYLTSGETLQTCALQVVWRPDAGLRAFAGYTLTAKGPELTTSVNLKPR